MTNIYTEQLDNITDEAVMTTEDAYAAGLIPHHIHHTTIGGPCLKCGRRAVNGEWSW
jgi:hypothetical protein